MHGAMVAHNARPSTLHVLFAGHNVVEQLLASDQWSKVVTVGEQHLLHQ